MRVPKHPLDTIGESDHPLMDVSGVGSIYTAGNALQDLR